MKRSGIQKLHSRSGLVRAALVLIIPIIVLLGLIAWPSWKKFRWQSSQTACNIALATAKDHLTIDYIANNDNPTVEEAREVVTQVMDGWSDLCPDGGTVYLVKTESEPPYMLICGLHDADDKKRTRLNAMYVKTQIEDGITDAIRYYREEPQSISVHVNGQEYMAEQVNEEVKIYRGTAKTEGFKGIVIRYTVAEGKLSYFLYADEDHCAKWSMTNGWIGDSFE